MQSPTHHTIEKDPNPPPHQMTPNQPSKLNLGCGPDVREGFINIDADPSTHPDIVANLITTPLTSLVGPESVSTVLAYDFIEHLTHFEAVSLLKQIHAVLIPNGTLYARLPDTLAILTSKTCPVHKKIELLYGGQDLPVDSDPAKNASRKAHPEFFCHKYGWTKDSFHVELTRIGFTLLHVDHSWPNFLVKAAKN